MKKQRHISMLTYGVVLCLQVIASSVEVEKNCKRMAIRAREKFCNPSLGDVTTAILAAKGKNFTRVCSRVEAYVQCMEPSVIDCEPSRVYEYWHNKMTYTSEPYHCTPSLGDIRNVSGTSDVFPPSQGGANRVYAAAWLWLAIFMLNRLT